MKKPLKFKVTRIDNTVCLQILRQDDSIIKRGYFKMKIGKWEIRSFQAPQMLPPSKVIYIQGLLKNHNDDAFTLTFDTPEQAEKLRKKVQKKLNKLNEKLMKQERKKLDKLNKKLDKLNKELMKKPLKFKVTRIDNTVCLQILRQDDNIIERGSFEMKIGKWTVKSLHSTGIDKMRKIIYIKGNFEGDAIYKPVAVECYDARDAEKLRRKVQKKLNKLNEKLVKQERRKKGCLELRKLWIKATYGKDSYTPEIR